MAKLTGQTIASSYDQLLIVNDADGISSSLQAVESADTGGSVSALQISTVAACIDNPTASSATQGGKLVLQSDDGAVMASGDRLGVIEFSGAEDTSSTITVGARIEALCDATWSGTENGADLVFYTTDSDASQSEGMRLNAAKSLSLAHDLTLSSDASILTFGAGSDVTFTHDDGTGMNVASAGDFDIAVSAGSGTFTVPDGQTLTLGQSGASALLLSPHGTAGSELASLINTAGTTDGSDAAGSILLSAVAGGIGLAWADGKDLWAEGGRAVITANEDAADCIKLHADAGTSQTITVVNDAGTTATEGSAAIQLLASAGGVNIKSELNGANAILLTADGGTSETIKVHADRGTAAASIGLASDAGGITLSAGNTSHGVTVGDISGAPVTIGHTTSETTISDNLTVTGDVEVSNGSGLVVGHTAQVTVSRGDGSTDMIPELQVLGTARDDSSLLLGQFGAGQPTLGFLKSNAAIGSSDAVNDNDELGQILFFGDDGSDYETVCARIAVNAQGDAASNSIASKITIATTEATGAGPSDRMTIASNGDISMKALAASAYGLTVFNDGNNANRYGILVKAGQDSGSGTLMTFQDGDGTEVGDISFSGGTTSYGAFTAFHPAVLPESDDSNGYPYGTLVEIVSIKHKTNSKGENLEKSIVYNVQPSSSAYAKNVLGAYSEKIFNEQNDGVERESLHQIWILGDGHILCNGEKGNISIGDGITTSSVDGQGMKADKLCMAIGIAQENISFSGDESKLVAVQYGLKQFTPWQ